MIGLINNFLTEGHKALPLTASLFFNTEIGIDDIRFDLFIDESHGLEFQLSEHPVQDGSVITDHVTQKLRTCTISGMFTNHSAKRRANNTKTISIEGYESAPVLDNVAKNNYLKLEDYAKRRLPVRLVTSLITYPKMMITNVKAKRGPDDGECVKFSMTLKEFKTVSLVEVSADYVYRPDTMDADIDKFIASSSNNGLVSATQRQVTKMIDMLGVQQ